MALLLFQRGFLLKRTESTERSSCADVASRESCWFPARYEKLVILLIDALRYDFVEPTESTEDSKYYVGRMKHVKHLLDENNETAVLMHFQADPPTTTMQRLKGLTTGSLPTFIDVGSNFGTDAVIEDNWIDQFTRSNKQLVFLGDDTWLSLYPRQFLRTYHMPSFDVNDLHSVDDMITANIYKELSKWDWTVLIAHYLGVDHCGHKYGPKHPQMSQKLEQIDELIANVTRIIDDETLLIVMGDHGMTDTGDHGGDEPFELDAALFMYSKNKLVFSKPPTTVSQIDIVPTISLLLDSPIPYSSVGTLIDCLIEPKYRPLAVSSNAEQMIRYSRTASAETELPYLGWILRHFESSDDTDTHIVLMHRLQGLFRLYWTQFNDAFMRIGIFSMLEAIMTVFESMFAVEIGVGDLICSFLFRSGLFFLQVSLYVVGGDETYEMVLDMILTLSILVRCFQSLAHLLAFDYSLKYVVPTLMLIIHASSYFSNSYIVFESLSARFMMQSLVVFAFMLNCDYRDRRVRTRGKGMLMQVLVARFGGKQVPNLCILLLLLRLGVLFERCREEQQFACIATLLSEPFAHISYGPTKILRFLLGISTVGIGAFASFRIIRHHPSERGPSSIIYPSALACIATWLAGWLPEKTSLLYASFSLTTAQIVYALALLSLILLFYRASRAESLEQLYGCSKSYIICFSSVLFLILGDGLALSFASLIAIIFLFATIANDEHYKLLTVLALTSHGFFTLAHQPIFSAIPWHAAFIGIQGNFTVQQIQAALVLSHIFAATILACVSLPLITVEHWSDNKGLAYYSYKFLLIYSLRALFACLMATMHRRHLMVWKIFAPKFIFESISLCVTCVLIFFTNCIFHKLIVQRQFVDHPNSEKDQ